MTTFSGTVTETFTTPHPPEVVASHFADPAAMVAATDGVESHEIVDAHTVRLTLKGQSAGKISFQPAYTVRLTRDGLTVRWETTEGNLDNAGSVTVSAKGDGSEVAFTETIAFDLPVPKLMRRMVQPMVNKALEPGIRGYLSAMKASLGA